MGCTVKINCVHGYFIFEESAAGQVSRFMSLFPGLSLVSKGEYFTFKTLADADTYSIAGSKYLGALSTETFEGKPWEVMRANNLVFNFQTDAVVPIATVTQRLELVATSNYFLSPGLILPGSLTDEGKRVKDYAAWYLFDSRKFKYSEVNIE